jgi:hypothetical protein
MAKIQFDPLLNKIEFADTLTDQQNIIDELASDLQGHYSLLSNFYFTGGLATSTIIPVESVDTWLDIILTVDPLGTFDYRPDPMQLAQPNGHSGTGASGDPIIFKLEGLTQTAAATLRLVLSFDPDEDGSRLETRLLFTRHSGTTPSDDFAIEATPLAMESGADTEYPNTPSVQFFIGDTIDTNAPGDAGTVRVQIKTDGAGTVSVKEMGLFIQV